MVGVAHINENCIVYVYIIPLITYSPIMEGDAERNENCNVCVCILFPWSHISQTWRGLLTEMRIAISVCVYYSFDHLFSHHGGGCWEKWELQCLCVYIIPLIIYFPNMEGVAHRIENCIVCICILFLWSPISPTWKGFLTEMIIAMSARVYYSLDHIFPKHGGGCSQKWKLQCLYVYIIPLITYSPKHVGGCSHKRELQCICVCYSLGHVFPQIWSGCSQKWELQCICVYYSRDHLFPQRGGCCREKWELQCLCVYIIPLITCFPNMEGLLTKMRIALSVCVYYSFDHLFSHHGGGCWEKWELQCLCVYIIPLITYFPNMEGVAHRNENCIVCICILFLWSPISPTCKRFVKEMIIAMSARVYYSLDHLFPHHRRCCAHKWELQCLPVYIIPLITYFRNMEGVAHLNENCNVSMCILFPWSPISPTWRGLLTEMRIAMSVYEYYSFDHLFFHQGGGCWEKWELQCMYVYIIPLITYFPKHVGGCSHKRELQCICVCYSLGHVFPQIWRGCSQKWELQCICVYYSLDHLFPQHGGCCREKWELQCLCVYIIPLITYFPNMEGVAHKNENCIVCMCILFLWSPIFPSWRGMLREIRIAMSVCVYYSLDHLFPQHGGGCSQKWELHCLYIYIIPLITYFSIKEGDAVRNENCNVCICISSLDHIFPKHGGGCSQKWELQCLFVYIIPLITYFPKHVGGCSHKRELQCICVCYSLGHVFPQIWSGCSQKWELQCICVYYSRDHLFPQRGGCCREKWELQCLCVYIIPLITYFPNMEGVAHRNENCNVCIWILFLWSPIFPSRRAMLREMRIAMYVFVYYSIDHIFPKHWVGCSQKWKLQCLYVYIIPLITYFPKHVGGCSHERELQCICVCYSLGHVFPQIWRGCSQKWELQCICVYYSLDHLFPQHGGCCREKWELQCLCVYIIPLITYFPNMEGVAHKNENCIVCMCILFPWSPISPTWRGLLTEMRIAMSVYEYYSFDHLFFHQGGGCWEKWELQCMYLYIIPLITYFPNMEWVAHRNENCNVCMCILFPWSPISPNM